jgi:hypothetical protein
MQPFFFICHSTALCACVFGIADDTAEFLKFFGYILLLPLAKLFCFFCHNVPPGADYGIYIPFSILMFRNKEWGISGCRKKRTKNGMFF